MTFLPALLLVVVTARAAAEAPNLERRFLTLGTEAQVSLFADLPRAELLAASERVRAALVTAEERLSTWRDDSELARLNGSPVGREVPLSAELTAELAAAFRCRAATRGAFDPEVGHLVTGWGLRTGGRWPAEADLQTMAAEAGRPGLELDVRGRRASRRCERTLDEGAWGKGAALDHALSALGAELGAEIDLGGQWIVSARRATTVALAHPRERHRRLAALDMVGGSVATSGNGERSLVVAGRPIGHLLDPRTGRPAPDFGSVTVWAPTALEADCLSTGLFVLGPEAALAYAASHPGVEVVVVETGDTDTPRLRASAGLRGRLRTLDPSTTLEFSAAPERPDAHYKRRSRNLGHDSVGFRLPHEPW